MCIRDRERGESNFIQRAVDDALECERGLRREFAGLEDDGVAGDERGEAVGGRNGERVVPGSDDADDAERLPFDARTLEAQGQIVVRNILGAQNAGGIFGAEERGVGGDQYVVEQSLLKGLAAFGGDDLGEGLLLLVQQAGDAAQKGGAADERKAAPTGLRLAGTGDGRVDLGFVGDGVVGQALAGGGVGCLLYTSSSGQPG